MSVQLLGIVFVITLDIAWSSTSSCPDRDVRCPQWAAAGECDNNPFWMKPTCQRSCDSCGMSANDVPVGSPIGPAKLPPPPCVDTHPLCLFWALFGECFANGFWMIPNCCASCAACPPPPRPMPCVNYHSLCNFWASANECTKNAAWMKPNCRPACGLC